MPGVNFEEKEERPHCDIRLVLHPLVQVGVRGRDVQGPGVNAPLLIVEVFVSEDLVKDPVEDVEEEEGQREAGPRHRVDLLSSVDEQLPHLLCAFTPAAAARRRRRPRWILGRVSGGVRCGDSVVGAGLGVLGVAGSGGRPALMDFPFLLEEDEEKEDKEEEEEDKEAKEEEEDKDRKTEEEQEELVEEEEEDKKVQEEE